MTVSELARRAGVTADTVRHYSRNGLLTPIRDQGNGYNRYGTGDLARLLFIRKARLLGFKKKNEKKKKKKKSHGHSPCPKVRRMMQQRIEEIRRKLKEMSKLKKRMEHAAKLWADMPDGVPDGHDVCQLIQKIEMEG